MKAGDRVGHRNLRDTGTVAAVWTERRWEFRELRTTYWVAVDLDQGGRANWRLQEVAVVIPPRETEG